MSTISETLQTAIEANTKAALEEANAAIENLETGDLDFAETQLREAAKLARKAADDEARLDNLEQEEGWD